MSKATSYNFTRAMKLFFMTHSNFSKSLASQYRLRVHGHCRFLLPWLRVPCWFFCNPWSKNCLQVCHKNKEKNILPFAAKCFINITSVSYLILLNIGSRRMSVKGKKYFTSCFNLLKRALQIFYSLKAHCFDRKVLVIYLQPGVKGCLELPGFKPQTLRFPAWCSDVEQKIN